MSWQVINSSVLFLNMDADLASTHFLFCVFVLIKKELQVKSNGLILYL